MRDRKRFLLPRIFWVSFGGLVLVMVADKAGILRFLRGLVEEKAILPIKQSIYDWKREVKYGRDGCSLEEERKITELEGQIAVLKEENLAQKKMLSAPLPSGWQFLPAKVVEVKEETLVIDKGRKDGVAEGMAAFLEKSFLGKVVEVSEKVSKVRLPSFLNERYVVKFYAKEEGGFLGRGLLEGKGLGKMVVEQVLFSEPVKEGDLVMVDFEGQSLLVGKVKEIIEDKKEVFKKVEVERLYNPDKLQTIFLKK